MTRAAVLVLCATSSCARPTGGPSARTPDLSAVEHLHRAEHEVLEAADAECDARPERCAETQRAVADLAERINDAKGIVTP